MKKNLQNNSSEKRGKFNDVFLNTVSTYGYEENKSNSMLRSSMNIDSFDVDYDNHIVLRNSSSNIFKYTNTINEDDYK